jgi:hypothetical protein
MPNKNAICVTLYYKEYKYIKLKKLFIIFKKGRDGCRVATSDPKGGWRHLWGNHPFLSFFFLFFFLNNNNNNIVFSFIYLYIFLLNNDTCFVFVGLDVQTKRSLLNYVRKLSP